MNIILTNTEERPLEQYGPFYNDNCEEFDNYSISITPEFYNFLTPLTGAIVNQTRAIELYITPENLQVSLFRFPDTESGNQDIIEMEVEDVYIRIDKYGIKLHIIQKFTNCLYKILL